LQLRRFTQDKKINKNKLVTGTDGKLQLGVARGEKEMEKGKLEGL
jgi:hypothetical protein